MPKGEHTEQKILEAAREVFQEKGFEGARMQEIADTAEINKGLLHYYFKTKNALFEKVFGIAFDKLFSTMTRLITSDLPLQEKLEQFVDTYLGILSKNAYLPPFVISELNRNPDKFIARVFARRDKPDPSPFIRQVEAEVAAGRIRPVDPKHLIINIISLCIFPYLGRPMFQAVFGLNKSAYRQLLRQRREEIVSFVRHSIER